MPLFSPPRIKRLAAKGNLKGLIKALDYTKDINVQRDAIEALGQSNRAEAVDAMLAFGDRTTENKLKREIIRALGHLGDPRAIPYLIAEMEKDPSDLLIQTLAQFGDPQITPALISAYNQRRGRFYTHTRCEILKGLALIGGQAVIDLHLQALEDVEPDIQHAAKHGLDHLGWKPKDEQGQVQIGLLEGNWRKLKSIGPPAVKPSIDALDHPDRKIRQTAIIALGWLGEKHAVKPLADHAHNRPEDREKVYLALGRLGGKSAAQALAQAFFENSGYNIQTDIKNALLSIGSPAVDPLMKHLKTRGADQWEAISLLGALGAAQAFNPILDSLKFEGGRNEFNIVVRALAGLYEAGGLTDLQVTALKEQVIRLSAICTPSELKPLGSLLPDQSPDQDQQKHDAETFLMSENRFLRIAAVNVLESLGEKTRFDLIEPLLLDQDPAIQKTIQKLLKKHTQEGILWLVNLLQSGKQDTRLAAVQMLKKIYQTEKLDRVQVNTILQGLLGLRKTEADRHTDTYFAESESGAAHTDSIPEVNFHGLDDGRWYI